MLGPGWVRVSALRMSDCKVRSFEGSIRKFGSEVWGLEGSVRVLRSLAQGFSKVRIFVCSIQVFALRIFVRSQVERLDSLSGQLLLIPILNRDVRAPFYRRTFVNIKSKPRYIRVVI